jgi:predicted metal-binding membrane protein
MNLNQAVEQVLKRDRLVVGASLVGVTLLAWVYLVSLAAGMNMTGAAGSAGSMDSMSDMGTMNDMGSMTADEADIGRLRGWMATEALLTVGMWAIMMVGMMTPSATPVVLLYARVVRHRSADPKPLAPTGAFFLGYLTVWAAFSVGATALQWSLEQLSLLSPMLVSISPLLSSLCLIAAGVYQWLPSKRVCLRQCRTPVDWLSRRWRAGITGAYRMGLEHGRYCLGCCWALMLLLFVGGVMNLLWVAAIAALILVEKLTAFGRLVGQLGGAALIAAGIITLF